MPTTTTLTRTALFQKSTRKNQEFERFLCGGQEPAVLDATTSKYIPLSYFVGGSARGSALPRRSHGLADKMPFESFRLINLQQKGSHAHSLVLFKSRAITTNPEHIAIFECNGQVSQSEIRILHTSLPPKEYLEDSDTEDDNDTDTEAEDDSNTEEDTEAEEDNDTEEDNDNEHQNEEDSDEPGTVYDVSELYFSPVSPKLCMNFGNNTYNPGYCGIFGIIAMVFYRHHQRKEPEKWIAEWSKLLIHMRKYVPNEPKCHGSIGTEIASKVQEIIAAHPSTHTGHQNAEKEIYQLLEDEIN